MRISEQYLEGSDLINPPKFDPEMRKKYANASEIDGCIRSQWYARHEEQPPQDWGFARRGQRIETYVTAALLASGVDLRLHDNDQSSLVSGEHMISGTPDGIIVTNEELVGIEIKSIDPRTNKTKLPKKQHQTQLQICMALIMLHREILGLPDLPITHGILMYIDASNFNDVIEFRVPFKPSILDQLAPRAKRMLNAKTPNRLPREGKEVFRGCQYCGFQSQCGIAAPTSAPTVTRANKGGRLADAVEKYVDAKALADQAKATITEQTERIKSELLARSATSLEVAGHQVSLQTIAGRKTFDKKAAEAAGLNLSPFEKVGTPSERLTVK